jgi:hypothetical protein
MKKNFTTSVLLVLILIIISFGQTFSQINQWTWVKGSKAANQPGVYGTQGTADSANNPGARELAITWKDASGKLWLFGGYGFATKSGRLNDLWKYNPPTNEWTWVKGDNTVNESGIYNIQGSAAFTSKPGARQSSVSWTDTSGNLWLFGGTGYADGSFGKLNDLWKYNPSTNQWTWVKGDNIINQLGVYGTQGTAASTNEPGARERSVSWTDASGNLWLFGGYGYGVSRFGLLNDLWKYNPSTNEWTWVKGDSIINMRSVYGTQGTVASANIPGARGFSVAWTDASGNLRLFGGEGYSTVIPGLLNDLWKYNLSPINGHG